MSCSRRHQAWLLGVFAVALALRLSVAAVFQGLDAPPDLHAQPDQRDYEGLAFRLSAGTGYTDASGQPSAFRPPGTSFALLPAYVVAGRSFAWGRVWFCVLSAATCLAAAWLALLCCGRATAVVAAAWLALYPGHFYYAMHFVSEVPFALWLTLACVFTVRALDRRGNVLASDVAAGLAWAMAALTRPQILLAIPIAGLWLPFASRSTRRRIAPRLLTQAGVLAVVLLAWVARNAVVAGAPTVAGVGATTFWCANNALVASDPALRGTCVRLEDLIDEEHPFTGNERKQAAAAWRYGFAFLVDNPGRVPGLLAMKIWRLVSPFAATPNRPVYWSFALAWLLTAPAAIGGIVAALRSNRVHAAVLLTPLLATVATAILFHGAVRFRDSVAPILVVFAANGLVAAGERAGRAEPPALRPTAASS